MRFLLTAATALMACAAPASAQWHQAKTRHFIIYSKQTPPDLKAYAERLERFDAAVRKVRAMPDPDLTDGSRLTVYVLDTQQAVESLSGQRGVAGFYLGRASGSVAYVSPDSSGFENRQMKQPDLVFFHEYLHHLMLSEQKGPIPSWIVEGGAEFFGTAVIEKDGSVSFGAPPYGRGSTVLADIGFDARQLLSQARPQDGLDQLSLYSKGWLLSHYLTFTPGGQQKLATYMRGIVGGKAPLVAAQDAFGDLGALDRSIDRYAANRKFSAIRVEPIPTPAVAIRALRPGEDEIMQYRLRSDRGIDAQSARTIVSAARKIGARFPGDPFVQSSLAEAEYDVDNYPGAIAAADRALAADPKNVQGMIYKGMALAEIARREPAKADWAGVRGWFIKANRADLENAEPLYLYYQTFAWAGQHPTAAAIKGLHYAQALAPQDDGLRLAAVRQHLADNNSAEASNLFGTIVFDAHGRKMPAITKAYDEMKAGKSKEALATLDEGDKKNKNKKGRG
ncbi:hypothetical protein [Sphingomonas glaciei]|uniref:DUF1570 domain-containing protein n=1 Tax=Sphingomonas glaciei TaxID=2938948 RepID=A0ABY5MV87_9SPHN|nr:hypothetical protein [Sphingomonas glaciei]UUR08394.1 hypothetical protein M1K48_01740 [Sphingomonas glaciei]